MATISLLGTLAGSGGSIVMANKLISYRLGQLETTVRERGSAVERIYSLERDSAVIHEQIREIAHRVELLEQKRSK